MSELRNNRQFAMRAILPVTKWNSSLFIVQDLLTKSRTIFNHQQTDCLILRFTMQTDRASSAEQIYPESTLVSS